MPPTLDTPPIIHHGFSATTIAWVSAVHCGATNDAFLAPVVTPEPPALAAFFTGVLHPELSLLSGVEEVDARGALIDKPRAFGF